MRRHYAAQTIKTGARVYRGVPTPKADSAIELVPATEGLTSCPVCHGGVKLIPAPYSDPESFVSYQKTLVLGVHRTGGLSGSSRTSKCAGSHQVP